MGLAGAGMAFRGGVGWRLLFVRERAWAWASSLAVLATALPSWAQTATMEETPEEAAVSAPKQVPVAPAPVARVTPPEPLLTDMVYPEGARGEASVELLLTVNTDGAVIEATVVSGPEPFSAHAARSALGWRFTPALREGKAVSAKIRFLARFVPPAPAAAAVRSSPPAERTAEPAVSEIVVLGEREPMKHELGRTEISRLPGAFDDAFRAIEALPGVTPVASGLPYFYVRGAPPGNVGYFFDGIPVPFLYHFGAGPSVFHPAFVERVDLYPGAYPVRYGRYAGAIVAGELAEPKYRTHGEWKVRLVDSGAMVEVPFAGGRGTAMLAGRISYTGLVFSLVSPKIFLAYGDYQGRVRYDLTSKDSIELLAFGSSDYVTNKVMVEEMTEDFQLISYEKTKTVLDVGFHRLDLRWNRRWATGTARTALMLGRDYTGLADGQVNVRTNLVGGRTEVRQQLNDVLRVSAGADVLVESLRQDIAENPRSSDEDLVPGLGEDAKVRDLEKQGFEERRRRDVSAGAFADMAWQATPALRVTPGVRADVFVSGKRSAVAVDPRVTAEYRFSKKVKVAHGLALVHQGPSFVGAVPGLKPSLEGGLQSAVQSSSSLSYELPAGFTSSVSVFQSFFSRMTDLLSLTRLKAAKNETDGELPPSGVTPPPAVDERTNGGAQGVELMLRRSLARRVGGFLSYTLSRSWRSSGRASGPSGSDRRHVLNVGGSVDLGRDWRFGGRVMVYSGVPSQVAYLQAARNPPRTPPFWRLDFKLEKRWYLQRPHLWWGLSLEVLNTTLNKETLRGSCNAYSCLDETLGPITVPSLAAEGAF
ncbi:MAG: TonB-dependent receptor [Myxococcales bacterium]|nr:MAG: TonB-dependent receptor [Myxococcales bacterium]